MSSFVYLIRNGDLYIIGSSSNLERTLTSYKPGELVASLKTDNHEVLTKNLRRTYLDNRLPCSDYFRLSNSQARECKGLLDKGGDSSFIKPFFTGYRLILFFFFTWFLIAFTIIQFAINPILVRFS